MSLFCNEFLKYPFLPPEQRSVENMDKQPKPAASASADSQPMKRSNTSQASAATPVSPATNTTNNMVMPHSHLNSDINNGNEVSDTALDSETNNVNEINDTKSITMSDNLEDQLSVASDIGDMVGREDDIIPLDPPVDECEEILNAFITDHYVTKKPDDIYTPPVSDLLASTIDSWAFSMPTKDQIKSTFEECKIPKNIISLSPIRINDVIYQRLPARTKEMDRQAKNQASYFTQAMGPSAFIWDSFIKAESWAIQQKRLPPALKIPGGVTSICDLTACLSVSMKLLCYHRAFNLQKRKGALKPHLDPKYHLLTSPSNPITQFLFGDNLEQRVQDIYRVSQAAHNN